MEYAEKGRYNASQVPPEWHGWLHHITDHTGDEVTFPESYCIFRYKMSCNGERGKEGGKKGNPHVVVYSSLKIQAL